ncbi:hypothetical protein [Tardibacter chloracetimidivorans]|uniref:hypothetical protein n=1 Tax=Tardibacter chloracetimidivorans TaxID=1921510 RepID=UPI00130163D6|nr:hypothetical protein [Tardibacter chloracetimidivorans]
MIVSSPAIAGQSFAAYEGQGAYQEGTGGSRITKHGIDYWTNGTPPRRFQLLGFLTDKRRDNNLVPDVVGSKGVAKAAIKHGGDAVVMLGTKGEVIGLLGGAVSPNMGYGAVVRDKVTVLAVVKYLD